MMHRLTALVRLLAVVLVTSALGCSKPRPVELTPRSAAVTAMSPQGLQLSLVLSAHNPNSFPIVADSVTGVLELTDGTELGRGQSTSSFTIPAEGERDLSAQLDVRLSSLSALAPYALAAQPVPYRIRGTARIGSSRLNMDVPFTLNGQLTAQQVIAAALGPNNGGR